MFTRRHVLGLLLLAACGGDVVPVTPDAAGAVDGAPGCDVVALLPTSFRPIAQVSMGTIDVALADGSWTGTIDATAGGTAAAADNPYIYLDLDAGRRVDLTDVAAFSSTAWHLAIKRASVRLNGGDSGPGQVAAARVPAASLGEVVTAPSTYATDAWAAQDCTLVTLPGGEPATAMGDWYDYDPATHQVSPKPEVWVIRGGVGADAPVWKLRIASYYGDPASPMRGAYYQVEWARM